MDKGVYLCLVVLAGSSLLFQIECVNFDDGSDVTTEPEVGTKNVTAHYCPFPCTVGNQTLCYPPPCPPPFCVYPVKLQPTDCCEICKHGPDCKAPDGSIILYNHWKIVAGKNCTCVQPLEPAVCV